MTRVFRKHWLFSSCVLLAAAFAPATPAAAQNISRTITVDGNFTDWTSPVDITSNPGQFSTDCEGASRPSCDLDYPVQSNGRDLRTYAYTWDEEKLYFFVERFASAKNTTTWLFYMDESIDGKMQTGEHFFAVEWQGNNRSTNAILCTYIAQLPAGDTMRGDGHTMPGRTGMCTNIYTGRTGGSTSGLQMEAELPWSDLDSDGPKNIIFHISSSQGFNLPSQVRDNMTGPGGGSGQLFPPDLRLTAAADTTEVGAFDQTVVSFHLRNIYFQDWADVRIGIALPAPLAYVSHAAPPGSAFVDTDGDGVPDSWQIDLVTAEDSLVLEVTAKGTIIPATMATAPAAELISWTGVEDTDSTNNADSVSIDVLASPILSVAKFADAPTATPGQVIAYTSTFTNTAEGRAWNVIARAEIDPSLAFRLDTFGPGKHLQVLDGAVPSGLAAGTPQFSNDGGVTWTYTPVSGGGGAPSGYDASVTNWRVPMGGFMNGAGAFFEIRYHARVR